MIIMENIKVYGTDECPSCTRFKKILDKNDVDFEYIDILKNMKNLKEYLKYRDSNSKFDKCKEQNRLGIPLVVKNDGEEIFVEPEELKEIE